MAIKEPKFMQELHKIRAQMTKEWNNKTPHEIISSIRKEAAKSKGIFFKNTSTRAR
ncbi:MAG: hypothetical protein KKH11_02680 [Candidatus Omnitrophica bacterium]|nr:hypothetical protein [Candidatus Omnitrophota bacterium]